MVNIIELIKNTISEHIRRGYQIATIQVERGTNPLNEFSRYTHFIAHGFISDDPQMTSEDALDKAIKFTNRRMQSFFQIIQKIEIGQET